MILTTECIIEELKMAMKDMVEANSGADQTDNDPMSNLNDL